MEVGEPGRTFVTPAVGVMVENGKCRSEVDTNRRESWMPSRNTLPSSDVARIIAACTSARERLVILGLVETGLRAAELSRLEQNDLDLNEGALRVAGRAEPVLASPVMLSLLAQEFRTRARMPLGIRQIQRIVPVVARRAGLESIVTPDVLRRTWLKSSAAPEGTSRHARERLLEAAADAAVDIILVADDERRFVDLNRAASDALRLPREELIGRRIEEFFSEAQGKPVPTAWSAFIAQGEQWGVCELRAGSLRRAFEYRAKAHFRRGLHLSILGEVPSAEPAKGEV